MGLELEGLEFRVFNSFKSPFPASCAHIVNTAETQA